MVFQPQACLRLSHPLLWSLKFSAEADWRNARPPHFLLFVNLYRLGGISMTFLDFGIVMHTTLTHLFNICRNYTPVLNGLKNEIRKEQSDKSFQSYCHLILTVHCLLHTHVIGRCNGRSLIVYYYVCGRLMLQFFETATTYNFFHFFFRTGLCSRCLCPISQWAGGGVFIFYGTFPKGAIITVFVV